MHSLPSLRTIPTHLPQIVSYSMMFGSILSWGIMWPLINNKASNRNRSEAAAESAVACCCDCGAGWGALGGSYSSHAACAARAQRQLLDAACC